MHTHAIMVDPEDMEHVDTIRYVWKKLHQQVAQLQTTLLEVQPGFHSRLLDNVTVYREQVKTFTEEYSTVNASIYTWTWYGASITVLCFPFPLLQSGPMVQGILPRQASDKLIIFQVDRHAHMYALSRCLHWSKCRLDLMSCGANI